MTRLQAPAPPSKPMPPNVPVLAMCAPVVGAVVLWALTQLPMMLLMAFLGPLIGIASVGDARRSAKKQRGRERERFDRECRALSAQIDRAKDDVLEAMTNACPSPKSIVDREANDPFRWRWSPELPLTVHVGIGQVPSGIVVESNAVSDESDIEAKIAALQKDAAFIDGPVVLDAQRGIGVVGPGLVAHGVARSLVVQLVEALEPRAVQCIAVGAGWEWLAATPHDVVREDGSESVLRVVADSVDVTIAIASSVQALPRDCRQVIHARLDHCEVNGVRCVPAMLSSREVERLVGVWTDAAAHAGIVGGNAVPTTVSLDDLQQPSDGVLAATFLHGTSPVSVDLALDGPHAVVGGTTGAGKSELLLAWIAALATRYTPSQLAVLLVDFKGGASFGPLTDLAHCVGVITDLDEQHAVRAIESLRAEMRYRERVLAEQGAKSIDDSDALARLVIVVDEFAAMLQDMPELQRLFADIAARGRSLGMHLILCTQRPAEAVRGTVLANCGVRISLRVTDEADAVAVTGSRDAAHFRLDQRGRCMIRIAGAATTEAQSALASPSLLDALVVASQEHPKPRRPWCDPLPAVVQADALDVHGDGIPIGLVDRPAQQRIDTVLWRPLVEGPLLALGASSSGKSTLVASLTHHGGEVIADEEALWDALHAATTPGLTVIDDIDLLLARAGDDYATVLASALATRIRESASSGRGYAMTARRLTTAMHQFAPLADVRLFLRLASRQEHVIAGGASDHFDSAMPPGGAWLAGERVQLVHCTTVPNPKTAVLVPQPTGACAYVVADASVASLVGDGTTPADIAQGTHGARVAGTVAEWEAAWGALDRLRAERPIVAVGVEERQLRQVVRGAGMPPLMRGTKAWVLQAGQWQRIAHPRV